MSVDVLPCCLLLFSQMDSRSSKSIPIVITVIIVMLLSVAGGIVFVKKYVCGGRLVYLSAHVYNPVHNQNPSAGEHDPFYYCPSLDWMCFTVCFTVTWRCFECALQVLGSQVLGAAAACWGPRRWWDGRTAGDQPHSKWQDWVSWRLRWGTVDNFYSLIRRLG